MSSIPAARPSDPGLIRPRSISGRALRRLASGASRRPGRNAPASRPSWTSKALRLASKADIFYEAPEGYVITSTYVYEYYPVRHFFTTAV